MCRGDLEFLVEDDGLGIGDEKLKVLNDPGTAIENGEVGIGLRHIYDTLRLYYARNWEWSIVSGIDQGTTVRILLKKLEESASEN
ncbi:hypothetical protein D3C81_1957490 [compost metagenome]